ncbi:MAG: MotA/TolQ/ExbB proton channel family protein [Thermoguttaceae bacterium]|nr:MotA/TolQ/ExbB proton channel family protein [Thermoguttaceae bacterium]
MYSLFADFTLLDKIILGFGITLLALHAILLLLSFFAGDGRPHPQLKSLQGYLLLLSELLPLMGLLGTVQALLFTFRLFSTDEGNTVMTMAQMKDFLQSFAPALTTTANGLYLLIPNLLLNALVWLCLPKTASAQE